MWGFIIVLIIVIYFLMPSSAPRKFNNGICPKCNVPFELIYSNGGKHGWDFAFEKQNCHIKENLYQNPIPASIYECSKCKKQLSIYNVEVDQDVFKEKFYEAVGKQAKKHDVENGLTEENYWN